MSMLAIARAQRICTASRHVVRQAQIARTVAVRRDLHQTAVALKKKGKQSATDDLFEDSENGLFDEEGDLFATDAKATRASKPRSSASSSGSSGKLSPEERLTRFNTLYEFLSGRIGQNPPAKARKEPEQVRKTAWQHLFGLATTAEQLERVTELFPKWRDSRQVFSPKMAEAFVRRCEELQCPTLALKVFGDHSKYGFDLTYLPAARQLLHSLHMKYPLEDSITLSALYNVYKLPAISSDLISCAMLTSACFKSATEESLVVANALVPELRGLLEKASPKKLAYPEDKYKRSLPGNKEKAWLRWTLLKIERALEAQKQPVGWLKAWREAQIADVAAAA